MTLENYVLTGFSVFVGAAAAFILTEVWNHRKQKSQQHKAALYAQFVLVTQYNALAAFRKQQLQPNANDPHRELVIKPTAQFIPNELIDFSSVDFYLRISFEICVMDGSRTCC